MRRLKAACREWTRQETALDDGFDIHFAAQCLFEVIAPEMAFGPLRGRFNPRLQRGACARFKIAAAILIRCRFPTSPNRETRGRGDFPRRAALVEYMVDSTPPRVVQHFDDN